MKRVKKIIFVILSILLGLILIFNVYNFILIKVLHKDLASINGYALLEVVSGSMEPTIHKGDMIIINTKENDYKENDIITFRGSEGEFITHRILKIDEDFLVTKGDNNNSEDNPIKSSAIVGKYVTKIKGAGTILTSFKNPFTLVMIFVIGLLACFLLSTDTDGNPLLDKDEKEFQEFLKEKNKKDDPKKVENKKTLAEAKNTTNVTSKNDTKETKSKKSTTKKEVSTPKTTKNSKRASSSKKAKVKAPVKTTSKKSENKTSATKKITPKKEATKKPVTKTTSTKKKVETKKAATGTTKTTTKKNTSTKNSKK